MLELFQQALHSVLSWPGFNLTIHFCLDNSEFFGESLQVAYARSSERRDDRRDTRREAPKEIILYRVGINNLSPDTTWQVCALKSKGGWFPELHTPFSIFTWILLCHEGIFLMFAAIVSISSLLYWPYPMNIPFSYGILSFIWSVAVDRCFLFWPRVFAFAK